MDINKEIYYQEYLNRENDLLHAPYNSELDFYSCVKSGNIAQVEVLCEEPLIDKKELGILSDNYVNHIRYHFVITTAMVARYCIEGGMELSTAYTLSDYYIKKADTINNAKAISDLHREMCIDYTNRMRSLRKSRTCSPNISRALDYIYDHLHTRISIEDLADHVGLSTAYLSRLFKAELGVSVTDYIRDKKIDTAKNMLRYSDYPIAQISNTLAFPSQSYFTEQFRKLTGHTPSKYRKEFHRQLL